MAVGGSKGSWARKAYCTPTKRTLARYKISSVVEFIESLPREDSGKIFKRKLRAPYWETAGRRI
jgi:long-chain acyl-CoA synthetase